MRLIDAESLLAWLESLKGKAYPCEDQRDAGYLDCLEEVIETVREGLIVEIHTEVSADE